MKACPPHDPHLPLADVSDAGPAKDVGGCRAHWFKLPKRLRDAIWRTYVPGQEISKTPSAEYLAVADEVQTWIAGEIQEGRAR
jgi:hypothetical protein